MRPDPKRVARRFLAYTAYPAEYAAQPLKSRNDYGAKRKEEETTKTNSGLPGDEDEIEEDVAKWKRSEEDEDE